MSWRDVIGKRVLVKLRDWVHMGEVIEVVVLEVSPSGKYVKFRHKNGSERWRNVLECELEEVLE